VDGFFSCSSASSGDEVSDSKAFTIWPKVEGMGALAELVCNLHWSRNHAADELLEQLDPEQWEGDTKPAGHPADNPPGEDQVFVGNAGTSSTSERSVMPEP
jgi:hypothetical protein